MKRCFKCGAEKPLTEFYAHAGMADGHLNKCKDCAKRDVRERRRESEHVREYDRQRGNRQTATYLQEYRQRFPKKYAAHRAVRREVQAGRLVAQPCECGSTFAVEAHHDDYDHPLVIRWLCAKCHKRWHAAHGEAANPF